MGRTLRNIVIGVSAAVVIAGTAVVWYTRERRTSFLTDAESIREAAAGARVRDVLWQPAKRLPVSTDGEEYEPRISEDGQTMFFVRGKAGENAEIWWAKRQREVWSDPQPLAVVNSPADDLGPEPSADGSALYFYSDRAGGLGGHDLWVSRRSESGWETPTNLGPAVNSTFNDYGAAITPDGGVLYFSSNRPKPGDPMPDAGRWPATIRELHEYRDYDLFMAPLTERGLGAAARLDALSTGHNEGTPSVSPFGDFLYFSSDRPGGLGGFDLYRSRRLHDRHEPPESLGAPINSASNDLDPALSMGGFALTFSSNRAREAPGTGGNDRPADYDLYRSYSREVFREHETWRASIEWRAILPWLWWLLLLPLLVLLARLLWWARGTDRFRQLDLLTRCLLASALIHALILLALAFWQVGNALEGWMKQPGGSGGSRVVLESAGGGGEIVSQILGEMTSVSLPPMAIVETAPFERAEQAPEAAPVETGVAASRPEIAVAYEPVAPPEAPTPLAEPAFRRVESETEAVDVNVPTEARLAARSEQAVSMPESPVLDGAARPELASAPTTTASTPITPGRAEAPTMASLLEAPVASSRDAAPAQGQLASPVMPALGLASPAADQVRVPAAMQGRAKGAEPALSGSPLASAERARAPGRFEQSEAAGQVALGAPVTTAAPTPSSLAGATELAEAEPSAQGLAAPASAAPVASGLGEPRLALGLPAAARRSSRGGGDPEGEPTARLAAPTGGRPTITDAPASAGAALPAAPASTRASGSLAGAAEVSEAQPSAQGASAPASAAPVASGLGEPRLALGLPAAAQRASRVGGGAEAEPTAMLSAPTGGRPPITDEPASPGAALSAAPSSPRASGSLASAPDVSDAGGSADPVGALPSAAPVASDLRTPTLALGLPAAQQSRQSASDSRQATGTSEQGLPARLAAAPGPRPVLDDAPLRTAAAALAAPDTLALPQGRSVTVNAAASAQDAATPRSGSPAPPAMGPIALPSKALGLRLPDETLDTGARGAAEPEPERVLTGFVFDAETGEPLQGARVRLDLPEGESMVARTGPGGAYTLRPGRLPEHVAVSASRRGYTPASIGIPAAELDAGARRDFRLAPIERTTIALEADPQVHHLGDGQFAGRINSQFQRECEGLTHEPTFTATAEQLRTRGTWAEVRMLAKGLQGQNEIRINGQLIESRLTGSPDDGSYGTFRARFPSEWLREGENTLGIRSVHNGHDFDDFEFVNVRVVIAASDAPGPL